MIDKIYYINLDHRTDRREHIENMLDEVGLMNISNRIPATFNENGVVGCVSSHINTLELFIESGLDSCLIIEDDLTITNKEKFVDNINSIFTNNVDFDVIQISGNHMMILDCEYNFLKRVHDSQTTSGYIISKEFAPILLSNFKESLSLILQYGKRHEYCLDIYWKHLQPISKWYCFRNSLGIQMESYSDIEKRVTSYGC